MIAALILAGTLAQTSPPASPVASAPPSPEASETPGVPQLTVSVSNVELNPAQQQTISVSGASPPLSATLDRKLVNVTVDPSNTGVTLTATQAVGSDVLHLVDANGARADVPIRVAFNAGTIVSQATLRVTGSPVDPTWLVAQVQSLVSRLTQTFPGVTRQIGQAAIPVAPLAPGAITQFSIPVSVTDPTGTYFDRTGTTVVNVQNVPLDPFAPPLLFYDDDPEHVTADGVLYRGAIAAAEPTRLYYYHDDGTDPRRLVVVLSSASQDVTSLQVIDATAGPNADVMHVGNVTTRQFLVGKAHDQGIVLDLQPGQPYVLHDLTMTSRQLVAGTIDFRVLSGGPVSVTVLAVSPNADPLALLGGPLLPGDGHHRTGVFRVSGFGTDALAYAVGGEDPKVVIGDRDPTPPSVDPSAAGHDYGDYGVTHTINVTLANNGDAPAPAYLYFRPLAGIARASFLVDGGLVELGCMRLPVPYQIAAYTLEPHQTQSVYVQTMTDGGSFYPVEIGVTQTAPQPSAPPIAAPDGCFPSTGAPPPAPPPPAPQQPLGSPTAQTSLSPSPEPT